MLSVHYYEIGYVHSWEIDCDDESFIRIFKIFGRGRAGYA